MLCTPYMLFLYLSFKFNELRFKGITNHFYKSMVIIIPQLEKNMFHMFIILDILKTIVQDIDGCNPPFL